MSTRSVLVVPAAVIAVLALLATGCGAAATPAAERSKARVAVPDVRGATLRDATCRLTDLGLRWRLRGSRRASVRQLSGCGNDGIVSSSDDHPITGQRPRPGKRVRPGTVVVLDTRCDMPRDGGIACVD